MSGYSLIEMLRYKRPEGSLTQEIFCERFLEPTFGDPDDHGNYIHIITKEDGADPNLLFTAHHDTVHRKEGIQNVIVHGDLVMAEPTSNCLGADCTTGVWLILGMIEAGIPGVYVVFAGEEVGCVGSSALVQDRPEWLNYIDAVISFDRKGEDSIVTHQMGYRTASDAFAVSLSQALDMPGLRPDNGGSYTDSNEFIDFIPECTNISVGYNYQHTSKEEQNVYFAYLLLEKLQQADWEALVFERDPSVYESLYSGRGGFQSAFDTDSGWKSVNKHDLDDLYHMEDFIRDYYSEVAEMLLDWGVTPDSMAEEMGIDDPKYVNAFINRKLVERKVG